MAFPTTCWTQLAEATLNGDEAGREALSRLCEQYRRPVIAYLRARGLPEPELEDVTQDFFFKLLKTRAWKRADQARGRFRTFLLTLLTHLMRHRARADGCQKRGGGQALESLDELQEEGFEPEEEGSSAAQLFDREWALTLVTDAVAVIEAEQVERGRMADFDVLRCYLTGDGEVLPYEEAAARTGLSLAAVKAAVHRLRQRFREVVRTAVARTVGAPHEVNEELRYLALLLTRSDGMQQPAAEKGREDT